MSFNSYYICKFTIQCCRICVLFKNYMICLKIRFLDAPIFSFPYQRFLQVFFSVKQLEEHG